MKRREDLLAMNKTKTHMPSTICTLATCLCLTYMPTAGWAFGEPDVQLNSYTEGGDAVIQGLLGDNEADPGARGCQSVCVRGLIYKYAVNLSG